MRYYFDVRDGDALTADDEGLELPGIEAVKEEAARSLADMAKDSVQRHARHNGHRLAIEVRDGNGPVLQAQFTFEMNRR
jgi:hypothetical protein